MKLLPNRVRVKQIAMGLLCSCIMLSADIKNVPLLTASMNGFDAYLYDTIVRNFPKKDNQQVRTVIIDIDERSVRNEGRWPWPRDKLALLISKLNNAGASVLALDIVMSEPEANPAVYLKQKVQHLNPDKNIVLLDKLLSQISPLVDTNQKLIEALSEADTILGFLFHFDKGIEKGLLPLPLKNSVGQPYQANQYDLVQFKAYNGSYAPFTRAAKHGGFVTNLPDGKIRKGLLLAGYQNRIYPSLALETVIRYLIVDKLTLLSTTESSPNNQNVLYELQLDGIRIKLGKLAQILIPFYGPPGTLDYFSATDILNDKVDPINFEGSIAIIGSTMILLADLHPTPVAQNFPGVEMVGDLVKGLISNQITRAFNWDLHISTLVLIALIFSFLYPYISIRYKLPLMLLVTISVSLAASYFFIEHNLYVPLASPLFIILSIALTNYAYVFYLERQEKKQIRNLFSQYIRSFTTISEKLDAAGVKKLLNTFFTPITEIIFRHQGTIDKYVGDMIVAFWGAPLQDDAHAKHGIEASLEIFERLDEINLEMEANHLPKVTIGIGLGTGLMNVGDMGSQFRKSYTVLGDIVNIASRLQDLTKYYKVHILVTEETQQNQTDFKWRMVDKVAVKGRESAITIYEPICRSSEFTDSMESELNQYEKALELYYSSLFAKANQAFKDLKEHYPKTYLYELYFTRSKAFMTTPPAEGWDGVFIHTSK